MMKNVLVVNIASYFLLVLSSFNNISNVVFVNGQVKQDDESKYRKFDLAFVYEVTLAFLTYRNAVVELYAHFL